MVLRPLEFADCLSDSPWFRQNLREHENVLEDAHKNIKNIEIQCRELIQCTKSKFYIVFILLHLFLIFCFFRCDFNSSLVFS